MSLSDLVMVAVALLSALAGALAAAARLGRAQETVARDVGDTKDRAVAAHARIDAHDSRIVALETSKAVSDERWRRVEELLEELREDVKELKGR